MLEESTRIACMTGHPGCPVHRTFWMSGPPPVKILKSLNKGFSPYSHLFARSAGALAGSSRRMLTAFGGGFSWSKAGGGVPRSDNIVRSRGHCAAASCVPGPAHIPTPPLACASARGPRSGSGGHGYVDGSTRAERGRRGQRGRGRRPCHHRRPASSWACARQASRSAARSARRSRSPEASASARASATRSSAVSAAGAAGGADALGRTAAARCAAQASRSSGSMRQPPRLSRRPRSSPAFKAREIVQRETPERCTAWAGERGAALIVRTMCSLLTEVKAAARPEPGAGDAGGSMCCRGVGQPRQVVSRRTAVA